jgi:hypothetical protein
MAEKWVDATVGLKDKMKDIYLVEKSVAGMAAKMVEQRAV